MVQPVSVNNAEIDQFSKMAVDWWDAEGPMALLHQINPLRLKYCRDNLTRHFALDNLELKPLTGLNILDVGCGGGLLSEPLANMGATMTAIDASEELIAVAAAHADQQSLTIKYKVETAEDLAAQGALFDAIVSMEVIEHVRDFRAFMKSMASLIRSYVQAILGAEYVLRWLPVGTHNWRHFRTPAELGRCLRSAGVELHDITGMHYQPRRGEWQLTPKTEVNYLAYAVRT